VRAHRIHARRDAALTMVEVAIALLILTLVSRHPLWLPSMLDRKSYRIEHRPDFVCRISDNHLFSPDDCQHRRSFRLWNGRIM